MSLINRSQATKRLRLRFNPQGYRLQQAVSNLAVGCNDCVYKSFSQEVILENMAEYLQVSYIYEKLP